VGCGRKETCLRSVRFLGYIQKVFANATYQYVRKGSCYSPFYSPDLVATERDIWWQNRINSKCAEYGARCRLQRNISARRRPAERLKQWGVRKKKSRASNSPARCNRNWTSNSPASGYITERNALTSVAVQPEMPPLHHRRPFEPFGCKLRSSRTIERIKSALPQRSP